MTRFLTLLISSYFACASAQAEEVVHANRQSMDSVYWLGYGGILSFGYQRLLNERIGINVSAASIALLHKDLRDGFSFPVHVSLYPIGDEHRMFIDLGVNFITKGKSNPLHDFYDGFNMPVIIGLGYNYHPKAGGLFGKVGTGVFIYEPKSKPNTLTAGLTWGLALGKAF